MINLIKNNSNGVRKNLFSTLKASGASKTRQNGVEVIVIQSGENVANIFENGLVNFSGFKNLNEIISNTETRKAIGQ